MWSGIFPDVHVGFIAGKALKYFDCLCKWQKSCQTKGKLHCNISASLDSQRSSEANTVKDRPHPKHIDGDESEEDPPDHKPSKLKRRQVAVTLSPECVSISTHVQEWVAIKHLLCYNIADPVRRRDKTHWQDPGLWSMVRSQLCLLFCHNFLSVKRNWCLFARSLGRLEVACNISDTVAINGW